MRAVCVLPQMHKHFQYHSPDLPRWSGSIAVRLPNSFSLISVLFAIIPPENNSPNIYAGVIVFWRNFLRKGGAPAANPFSISFCVVLDIWMLLLELLDTSYQKRFGPTIHITMLKMNLGPYFDPRIQLSREFIDEIAVELDMFFLCVLSQFYTIQKMFLRIDPFSFC